MQTIDDFPINPATHLDAWDDELAGWSAVLRALKRGDIAKAREEAEDGQTLALSRREYWRQVRGSVVDLPMEMVKRRRMVRPETGFKAAA